MHALIDQIWRYPVKGLSGQPLTEVTVAAGQSLPQDRRFAIALGTAGLDGSEGWRPPGQFLTLTRTERLALLRTDYDETSETLVIRRNGRQVARGLIGSPTGRMLIGEFFAAFMGGTLPGMPRLIEAPGVSFTDRAENFVSIVNLASVRDLERVVGTPVAPGRLRANLYIDGVDPWAELKWIGELFRIGTCRIEVVEPMPCSPAANVDPDTAVRDLNLPLALQRGYAHSWCGLYAKVITGGRIRVGDPLVGADLH